MKPLLLLLPVALAAQAPNTAPKEKCGIAGQVLNAATGEPVRKANVILRSAEAGPNSYPASFSASTSADGKFEIADIDPGKYRLTVNRAGFVNAEYGSRGPMRSGTTLALDPGRRVKDIVFKLTPHAVISGRVLDEDGEPVAMVQLTAMRYGYLQGRKRLMPAQGGMTNDLGEYRMFGLAPGKYYLTAIYRQSAMLGPMAPRAAGDGPEEGYVPTYYPNTTDPSAASPLEVAAGAQLRGMDFILSKKRTVRVSGRVVNATGTNSRNIMVQLTPREQSWFFFDASRTSVRDAEGRFELRGVSPGSYMLAATVFDMGKNFSARMPVDVGAANVENVSLTISPGIELTGHVRAEGSGDPQLANVRVMLTPSQSGGMMFGPQPGGAVKKDGSFTLADASAEQFNVQVMGFADGYYVKSIRAGDVDVLEHGLDLTRGLPGPLEIVLSSGAGTVTGTVLNSKQEPAPGVTVVLIPPAERRERMTLYKNGTTDQFGRFTLRNVDPGEYKLFAWEDIEYGAYMDPDFLKPVESRGKSVTVREGGQVDAELRVIPADDSVTPR